MAHNVATKTFGDFLSAWPEVQKMHRSKNEKRLSIFAIALNRSGIPPDKNIDVRSPQRGCPDLCFSPEERNVYAYFGPKRLIISIWVIASLPASPVIMANAFVVRCFGCYAMLAAQKRFKIS